MSFKLLLLLLLIVGVLGGFVWRSRRAELGPRKPAVGPKLRWLAFRIERSEDLVERLPLRRAERCDQAQGLVRARAQGMAFVLPPARGWVLLVSAHEISLESIVSLSVRLGAELQSFSIDSATGSYGWARVRDGRLERAHAVAQGEILQDQGEPSLEERELGLVRTAEREARPVDRDRVLALAARWSVNPVALSERELPPGWIGEWTEGP